MGKQLFSVEKKKEILKEAAKEGVGTVSERHGVHFTTIYDWKRKYEAEGDDGLSGKSGGHTKGPKVVEEWKVKEIVKEKGDNPGFGVSQIRNQLRRRAITISTKTIERVLKEKGYDVGKKAKVGKKSLRFEASRPLELVQIDIVEFYIHKARVYLLFLLDDFSRFILNFLLTDSCHMDVIQQMVSESIQQYGKMENFLSDRGFVFHGWKGANRFENYLDEEGVYHIHASSHHPQTIGKVERVNQTVQKELIRVKEFKDITHGRRELEKWIWSYNYERVHQGLGGIEVPADRFHGWGRKIDGELSKMVEQGISLSNREISLFQVKKNDEKVEIWILGQKMELGPISGEKGQSGA